MDTKELLDYWQVGTRIFHMAHHRASAFYARMQKAVGMSVVILTTAAGTTIISQLEATSMTGQVIVGLLSMAATVLAALQTFLNLEGRAEQHRAAALKYGMLRRRIELVLVDAGIEEAKLAAFMESFRTDWDLADKEAPILPQRFYDKAKLIVTQSIEAARKRREKH
ncbi:MAG: SLATT domain-containing protein [Hydrogenophilaceae bacterium]|nr:SLATT domain-containing protein [Hydrogenophilaceae bacterium]